MRIAILLVGSAHSFVYQAVSFGAVLLGAAAVLLALAWQQRSMLIAAVACVLLLWAGWALQPWFALVPQDSPGNGGEPHLLAWWRVASVAWIILLVGGVASLVALLQLRRL